MVTDNFFRISADLVFDYICYLSDIIDAVSNHIFLIHEKNIDYFSPKLDILVEES